MSDSKTTIAALALAASLLCSPAHADSLLTVSYGGVVSVVKGLDGKECDQMRAKMLENPCQKSWDYDYHHPPAGASSWNSTCTYTVQSYMIQRAECLK
jgi:hypothetical protein